jgi:hypothetical protein
MTQELKNEIQRLLDWYNGKYNDNLSELPDILPDINSDFWSCISHSQKLSEEFIREFKDKVDWFHISQYQKLSEEFIREFKDKVDWSYISQYQKLSESFIREFKIKLIGIKFFEKCF